MTKICNRQILFLRHHYNYYHLNVLFIVQHCDALPQITNGSFDKMACSSDGLNYNESCNARCDIGHYLVGDPVLWCNETASWNMSTEFPQCHSKCFWL